MRTLAPWLALAAMLSVSSAGAESDAELRFFREGHVVAASSRADLEEKVASERVLVHEPYEDRTVAFSALPLPELLDAVYSKAWRSLRNRQVLFTCRDGYQPTIPLERFLTYRAWLAFDRADAPGFSIDKLESGRVRKVSLDPFYVVWNNRDNDALLAEGDYGWPYQVVAIDLIKTEERFPGMIPPADSDHRVRAGFAAFQMHCTRCHPINGHGGTIGPELIGPGERLISRGRPWLRQWIDDPSAMVPAARMPRFNPTTPDRTQSIERIIDYLYAMDRAP